MSSAKKRGEELRLQGNACVKEGNYTEAVLHYSHALQCDPGDHLVYSNRSLAFLRLQQYYLALQDAHTVIRLNPKWSKGYFRKGEVEYQAGHYNEALLSYGRAFLMEPSSDEAKQAVNKTNFRLQEQVNRRRLDPWLYCGCGSLLGLLIVAADQYLAAKPSMHNIVIQVLLVVVFGCLGYLVLTIVSYIRQSEIRSRLDPPPDLLSAMDQKSETPSSGSEANGEEPSPQGGATAPGHTRRKGGTGAARQRYKKGKT
ncbi:HSOP3-like protein [Mya arenaria]|uniref:HSOP3-like protein n=1 Tax=Mya arenaria TaxID=6604 RepID=A0ABY7DRV3_MYAAR|nr:serine/threonine-protein phosphatase 5-like [Mya arenaria]WAR00433.1 HSOP3-like protein [Mya arenaria]